MRRTSPTSTSGDEVRATEDNVASAFSFTPDGSWLCVRSVTVPIRSRTMQVEPGMVFARGVRYMGVDLASWLDKNAA